MVVAFRLPFVLGNDIAQCSRFYRGGTVKDAQFTNRLLTRVLHPRELQTARSRFPQWFEFIRSGNMGSVTSPIPQFKHLGMFLAGRWAAKEAAKKAWGADIIGFRDVQVISDGGKVNVVCDPLLSNSIDDDAELSAYAQMGLLSISHDGDYAMATVIAEPLNQTLTNILVEKNKTASTPVYGRIAKQKASRSPDTAASATNR